MINDNTFVYWATERDRVRKKRESGVPRKEWTSDPILAGFRFCNVNREDDRVTRWIKEFIRDPFDKAGKQELLFKAVCLSRFINEVKPLRRLLDVGLLNPHSTDLDLHGIVRELRLYRDEHKDNRTFGAAYMVGAPPNFRTAPYGDDKLAYVAGVLAHVKMPERDDCYLRRTFVERLNKEFGFAEFMSGQIAADLAYTSVLGEATDHKTWGPRGPGAMRGMNRALKRPLNRVIPRDEYLFVGAVQMDMLKELVEELDLHMHDVISNVNCETDKYLRKRDDGKNPKRRY